MDKVNINKTVYSKNQYEKVIDTNFTQLVPQSSQTSQQTGPTVAEFFDAYNQLFFEIPKTGENSHETLVKRSSEYIDYQPIDDTVQALLNEIDSLQAENLSLNQQLVQAQTPQTNG
jgi:hypothetical protein